MSLVASKLRRKNFNLVFQNEKFKKVLEIESAPMLLEATYVRNFNCLNQNAF